MSDFVLDCSVAMSWCFEDEADAVRIANERNELRNSVRTLTRELEDVKQENRDLHNQTAQNWFMIGAGVIILGIILGLLLPHLRFQRRKSSWGSL